jgi:hypothetical protein
MKRSEQWRIVFFIGVGCEVVFVSLAAIAFFAGQQVWFASFMSALVGASWLFSAHEAWKANEALDGGEF